MSAHHVLVRHPPMPALAGLCYGRLDADLPDDVYEAAADALHAMLPMLPLASSPSLRCRRLANALCARRPTASMVVDDRLREMDFGDWEGRAWSTLPRAALDAWARDVGGFAPPGGESFDALTVRATAALDALAAAHIVVAHAGVVRAALRSRGMPVAQAAAAQVAHLQPIWLL